MSETLYSNPLVPIITNPINLDREIQEIQLAIALIPWIDKSFGRARIGQRNDLQKPYLYPEVYKGNGEYYNCLINDNLKASSFIRVGRGRVKDPINGFDSHSRVMTYTLNLIVWYDLKKIDPTKGYRFDEELKKDVMEVLRTLSSLKLLSIYDAPDEVFDGYSLDHTEWQTFKHPFGGFRFECELEFIEEC